MQKSTKVFLGIAKLWPIAYTFLDQEEVRSLPGPARGLRVTGVRGNSDN
jgi:hypothetical protein